MAVIMKGAAQRINILENNLLFKIDLGDGTSQFVQIPEEQLRGAALNQSKVEETVIAQEVNVQNHLVTDVDASDNLQDDNASHFVYKIVKPEDLNLFPSTNTHLTMGRPRKKLKRTKNTEIKKQEEAKKDESDVVKKFARTRSGRVTKPPRHIEMDFKKIDITDNKKHEDTDLKTSEFGPLRTNDTPSEEPLQTLKQPFRKRFLTSRFRCPTCQKLYLGKIRIFNHFQKHPDHRPASCKITDNNTWNYLLLTSQKCKPGKMGAKFCRELEMVLEGARCLAQHIFKPVVNGEEGYLVNDNLAYVFGISAGQYHIDEKELTKGISWYECLDKENEAKEEAGKKEEDNHRIQNGGEVNLFNFNDKGNLTDLNLSESQQNVSANIQFDIPQIQSKPTTPSAYIQSDLTISLQSPNRLAIMKYESPPKSTFLFNNHEFMDDDLHLNGNHLDTLPVYDDKKCSKEKEHEILGEKQSSHITLQNELRDVAELMLANVDTGTVSNILDTSSNSDDIMNVDQFVNERFKKFTEPDIDLQNNLLNLELPPLDMFNFHTS